MIQTPKGFNHEGIGGGFTAWIVRKIYDMHTHYSTMEFRVCHSGWSSAPKSDYEMNEPAFVEVFIEDLSSDAPQEAVAIMEARGLTGGSNGCSGALSFYFENARQAVAFVRDFIGGESQN